MPEHPPVLAVYSNSPVSGPLWLDVLRQAAPDFEVRAWPDIPAPERVIAAALWNPPAELFEGLVNLRVIQSFGAGVDHLWKLGADLPEVPILRLVDPVMTERLAQYALWGAITFQRRFDRYLHQQAEQSWRPHVHPQPEETVVGVLGLGVIGQAAAAALRREGFQVTGWSRTPRIVEGVACHSGRAGLDRIARDADILVNFLPLTPETRGLLSAPLFAAMRPGAYLISAGRGEHMVTADLLAALDAGHLGGALLDVFPVEPLPPDDRLWTHPKVIVTPHAAGFSNPPSAAGPIMEGIRAVLRGERPGNLAERDRGY